MKISRTNFWNFKLDWIKSCCGTHSSGLRFGQAFLNKFFPDVSDSELYYEENIGKCIMMIDKYVDWEKE